MKKLFRITVTCILAVLCAFSFAACSKKPSSNGGITPGGTPGGNTPGGSTTEVSGNIDFYTTVNIIEQSALQAVADAYADMHFDKGNDVTVTIRNNTDPDAYTQNVRNLLANGVNSATIVQTSVAPEYYGTDKILDLAAALEQPNPYIEGNEAWLDALEEDAYRARVSGATTTIPNISYSSDYLTVFYNKQAMLDVMGAGGAVGADGTLDASKITWKWMLDALKTARNSGKNFENPLGLSTSAQSCGEDSFNMLNRIVSMYLDQYFRDFIQAAHSQEGDFSYIDGIDSVWSYDQANPSVDLYGKYTYNINRVVDLYFNDANYAPTSARYAEVMENLYELMRYADQTASYNDIFSRFNETTIMYTRNKGSYSDLKLFYVEDLSYVRTYRDAFKTTNASGATVYPDAEQIGSELGWFLMPAMTSELEGVADNVRAPGGPKEQYGIISAREQSDNDLALDFLRYLYSPAGQAAIYSKYKGENNAPITMHQLIKGVEIPAEIDFTNVITPNGNCDSSPYLLFGKGGDMRTIAVGSTATPVKDRVGEILSKYFRGSSSDWSSSGSELFGVIKSGFANYASERKFIYNDPAKVKESTNNLVNSPYNTST